MSEDPLCDCDECECNAKLKKINKLVKGYNDCDFVETPMEIIKEVEELSE